MSLKTFFDNYKDKQSQRRIEKLTRRLCEKYSQSSERYAAAEELFSLNDDEARYGLLQRFQVQTPQIIEDEEEKKFIFELILQDGEKAIPSILRYLREKENLAYPLQLLHQIAGEEKTLDILLTIIKSYQPEYDRVPEKKIDIILALGKYQEPKIITALFPFLEDPQDDVVIAVIDILSRDEEAADRVRTKLLELILKEEEKPRIKRHVLELFVQHRWKVAGFRKSIEEIISDPYYLDKKGYVKKTGTN